MIITHVVVYHGEKYLVTKVSTSGGESSYAVIAECGDLTIANSIVAALS